MRFCSTAAKPWRCLIKYKLPLSSVQWPLTHRSLAPGVSLTWVSTSQYLCVHTWKLKLTYPSIVACCVKYPPERHLWLFFLSFLFNCSSWGPPHTQSYITDFPLILNKNWYLIISLKFCFYESCTIATLNSKETRLIHFFLNGSL